MRWDHSSCIPASRIRASSKPERRVNAILYDSQSAQQPHEIKMNFCCPVLTKGRSVGVHFLVTHRHAASTQGPEWRRPGAVAEHALVCSTCRWAQRESEPPHPKPTRNLPTKTGSGTPRAPWGEAVQPNAPDGFAAGRVYPVAHSRHTMATHMGERGGGQALQGDAGGCGGVTQR